MALKLRLARGGSKKRPYYRIVVADVRAPRDGRFIEKLGTYNPLLPKDAENRVTLDAERIQHWLSKGATPTDRVNRFLDAAGILSRPARNNPIKALPGKKAQERLEALKMAEEEAKESAKETATEADATPEEPAAEPEAAAEEEAPAEEAAAEETAAEEEAPAKAAAE